MAAERVSLIDTVERSCLAAEPSGGLTPGLRTNELFLFGFLERHDHDLDLGLDVMAQVQIDFVTGRIP